MLSGSEELAVWGKVGNKQEREPHRSHTLKSVTLVPRDFQPVWRREIRVSVTFERALDLEFGADVLNAF